MIAPIISWTATVIAIAMILFTILPMLPTTEWWIRMMGFPRVQILLLLLASSILLLWFRHREWKLAIAIGGLLCALYQFYEIFPFTAVAPLESLEAGSTDPSRRVRIMVSNVLQPNRNAPKLLSIVEEFDPDVVLAVETDDWWVARIVDALKDHYPYVVKKPLDNTYGMVLLSRYELIDPEVHFLVMDGIPSILTGVRLPSDDVFTLYAVHPIPPLPGADTDERDAELLIVAKMIRKAGHPAITLGDLNDVAWSDTTREFQKIGGMLDPRKGRGTFSTFHAKYFFLRYPLDHIFHTAHFRLVRIHRMAAWGSDHFPIGAELSFEPGGFAEQEVPQATADEQAEATEEIQEGIDAAKEKGR